MLDSKTVLITGANGVLGKAAIRAAREHGAKKIIALDLKFDREQSSDLIDQFEVDLLDGAAVAKLIQGAETIDAVLNIAGGFRMGAKVHELEAAEWDQMFSMNVQTLRNVVAATLPSMLAQRSGAIVNVGALGAREGQADMSAYVASKSVVMKLTESLAKEARAHGIHVNAVLPSIIDTPTNRSDMPDADFELWVSPKDLANTMCFLASDLAGAINGALIPVNGGL